MFLIEHTQVGCLAMQRHTPLINSGTDSVPSDKQSIQRALTSLEAFSPRWLQGLGPCPGCCRPTLLAQGTVALPLLPGWPWQQCL